MLVNSGEDYLWRESNAQSNTRMARNSACKGFWSLQPLRPGPGQGVQRHLQEQLLLEDEVLAVLGQRNAERQRPRGAGVRRDIERGGRGSPVCGPVPGLGTQTDRQNGVQHNPMHPKQTPSIVLLREGHCGRWRKWRWRFGGKWLASARHILPPVIPPECMSSGGRCNYDEWQCS